MFLQKVADQEGILEVRILKDVLPENLPAFKEEIYALTAGAGLRLRLNFDGVEQFCSWAIGVLAVAARRLQENSGELTVSNLSANLQRIFMFARLDRSIDVIRDRTATLAERAA